MPRRDFRILRLAAAWIVFTWAVFVRNLLGDEARALGFKVVHLTLAVVSVSFAVAIWRVASRNRQRASERAGTPS